MLFGGGGGGGCIVVYGERGDGGINGGIKEVDVGSVVDDDDDDGGGGGDFNL